MVLLFSAATLSPVTAAAACCSLTAFGSRQQGLPLLRSRLLSEHPAHTEGLVKTLADPHSTISIYKHNATEIKQCSAQIHTGYDQFCYRVRCEDAC